MPVAALPATCRTRGQTIGRSGDGKAPLRIGCTAGPASLNPGVAELTANSLRVKRESADNGKVSGR